VLEWRKAHLGIDHPSTYRLMGLLAFNYVSWVSFLQLEGCRCRYFKLNSGKCTSEWIMSSLAVTLHGLGELDEARRLQVQVLKWRKEHLGPKHKYTIRAVENLACTFEKVRRDQRSRRTESSGGGVAR
jgi:hypothetical protein